MSKAIVIGAGIAGIASVIRMAVQGHQVEVFEASPAAGGKLSENSCCYFQDLKFNRIEFDKNRSVLLLANHFFWWDGFVLFQINRLYFRKNFHVMITEENYRKVWFLKYLGSFSVKKNSRSVIENLF